MLLRLTRILDPPHPAYWRASEAGGGEGGVIVEGASGQKSMPLGSSASFQIVLFVVIHRVSCDTKLCFLIVVAGVVLDVSPRAEHNNNANNGFA